MIEKTKPVNLSFCDRDGIVVAGMDLFAENDGTGPFTIPPEEATENGEAQVQLLEGAAYEYLVTNRRMRLRGQAGVVLPSRVDDSSDRGRITPSLNVGRLRFVLISTEDGSEVGSAEVEIRSIKVGYRDEYRQMLEYITERCNDLLLEFRSPAMQNVLPEDTREPDTICQRFAFVRSLVTSRRFRDAVSRVIALPHRLWEQEEEQVPIGRGVKPSASIARQIASASRRIPLAASHPLRSRIPSVPEQVTILRIVESVDTAENRFVKHALRMFQAFAADTRQLLEHFHRERGKQPR